MIRTAPVPSLIFCTLLLGCAPQTSTVNIGPIEGAPELTEQTLQAFEDEFQCKLPDDYRRFLLEHNGGFPSPDCVTFEEDGRTTATDVFCFHAIGDERPWASLKWHYETFSGRLPTNTLPIAHDSCGNLWLLSIDGDHAGTVLFWDHGTFDTFDETDFTAWPRVAGSFGEFLDGLHEYEPLPAEDVLLSRYALVQQAVDGMAQQSPDFNKYTAPDYIWHCDHREEGKATMQFVNYQVHTITHTDGYSLLRAEQGLIKSGPARLPE